LARRRYGEDRAATGDDGAVQEGKVNPASGCLPLADPIFFALYKVLFVTTRSARPVLRLDQGFVGA
jgi:membrane protein insertase Oxa1/YidC/SpoIIIJ